MKINIPEFALVVLIGASGSGKSTFAHTHFGRFETVSSDFCRGLVSNDENDQVATQDAFDLVHTIIGKRLKNMKLTVVDATNVQPASRRALVNIAREYHALPVAIVLDPPERVCIERNKLRPDRSFGARVVANHRSQLRRSLRGLKREGFRRVFHLKSVEQIEAVEITRDRLWNDRKDLHGPFDIFGDIHGCYDELVLLLEKLGYQIDRAQVTPPEGRTAVFVGDLVDRGPKTPEVLKLVMGMVAAGTGFCVAGNHDVKLRRALEGKKVKLNNGLEASMAQLEQETAQFRRDVGAFLDGLISHYVFDDGKLAVAHAGLTANLIGRASGKVREFALYGMTTGEKDEYGLPVRLNWAADYRGDTQVVYGHTPVYTPQWLNRTVNIDTGCAFGGALTALRYPENETVSIPALKEYAVSPKPLIPPQEVLSAQQMHDDVLDISDVTGKRIVNTRLRPSITIREENSIAALEIMSRFAVNPRWLIYLPPTMSPCETSEREGYLEYPTEAFDYYRRNGVSEVICEEKHMGSRALIIVCKDEAAAEARFGVKDEGRGIVFTRTGRRFFNDLELEQHFVARVAAAAGQAGLWAILETDWLLLDCELMPWSAKAQQLLQDQYAAVGAAAASGVNESLKVLTLAAENGGDVSALLERYSRRQTQVGQFVDAYRHYCWPVSDLDDLKLAPFHLLASEGAVHSDKPHAWHMETLAKLAVDPLIMTTACKLVKLDDEASVAEATAWWEEMTGKGGEGMVVKPLDFITPGLRGFVQPAIKVRGREYLRIIYGPEYTDHLKVLRKRGLKHKRSMAEREFALGLEALERFVAREPLRRMHECVFGVLALESEPVDPRL